MAVRIEQNSNVWTIIHDRPEAKNAMDPGSADALVKAFEKSMDYSSPNRLLNGSMMSEQSTIAKMRSSTYDWLR